MVARITLQTCQGHFLTMRVIKHKKMRVNYGNQIQNCHFGASCRTSSQVAFLETLTGLQEIAVSLKEMYLALSSLYGSYSDNCSPTLVTQTTLASI